MSTSLNLKEIERKAFRSTHQDGLWDIYIGGIILSMAIMLNPGEGDTFLGSRLWLYIVCMGAAGLIFMAGKKFITTPRLGQVKFAPPRRRRLRTMALVLVGIVAMHILLVAGSVLFWRHPEWAVQLGIAQMDADLERLTVSVISGLMVGPSMVLIAYFNEFLRGYYIAFMLSLAAFSLVWLGEPLFLVGVGLLVVIPGVVLFIRFLRQHPLPPRQASHD